MGDDNERSNPGIGKRESFEIDIEEAVGKCFESDTAALTYYKTYARTKGFGVARASSKKDKKTGITRWISFSCHKARDSRKTSDSAASKPTSKTDCKAGMNITMQSDNSWKVTKVNKEHNHEMDPNTSKFLKCHQNSWIACEGMADDDNGRTRMENDKYNHMNNVERLKLHGGDANEMLMYFKRMHANYEDFFYDIDLDEQDCLKTVFWADARSREAYKEFGDVVTFDTTYLSKKHHMPFTPFVGVNHHGHSILLGCGLVTHEDTESFVWLFKAWLRCMSGIPPNAIITDQDRTMQDAISQVFPNTRHRWCLGHIMKKVPEKLKNGDDYEEIRSAIINVVYDSLTTDEFEKNWVALIEKFQLGNQEWLVYMYSQRNRWVPAFVKDTFWGGMSTTQRSESMNSFFDGSVCQETSLIEFAEKYENALRKKVRKEEEADAKSLNTKYTCMSTYGWENQFLDTYTNSKFKQFKDQLIELINCTLVIGPVIDGVEHFVVHHTFMTDTVPKIKKMVKFNVKFKGDTGETNCICRMFESKGMVCVHMMEVWKHKTLSSVSERYILKRWRKNLLRCHTKVRLSYTDWQKKPEWHRFDDLHGVFKEVAEQVIYDERRTRKFKEVMIRFLEENKQDCPLQIVGSESVVPSFVNPLPVDESIECENFHLDDPIIVAKRGRPDFQSIESHFDKAKKKKTQQKPLVSYQNTTTSPSSIIAPVYGRQHQSQVPWEKIDLSVLASNFNQQV